MDLSKLGIKVVSEPVPKEVQGQDCEEYSQSWQDSYPPGYRKVIPAIGHHDSPGRNGSGDTYPQEAQSRLQNDHRANLKSRQNNEGVRNVGEDVLEENSSRRRSRNTGTGNKIHIPQSQGFSANKSGLRLTIKICASCAHSDPEAENALVVADGHCPKGGPATPGGERRLPAAATGESGGC